MNGATTMKRIVFPKNARSRTPKPPFVTAAPAKPPSSAWDDDVGRPHHHVRSPHTIAPTRPAPTRPRVTIFGSTPFAMFPAMCVLKMRNATKLKIAAQITATFGLSTRVDTTVAMLFAASWNPLM